MNNAQKAKKLVLYDFTLILGFVYVIPMYMVVVNSLKDVRQANLFGISLPHPLHFDNYLTVLKSGGIPRAFMNGCIEAFGSVFVILCLSSAAAFIIARRKQKVTNAVYYIFILGLIVPIAFIPTYLVLDNLMLLNSYPGLILIFSTYGLPISIFLYTGFIKTIPFELDEAAVIDGCGPLKLFYVIIFPLLKPVTFSLVIFNFVGAWNDVMIPLFFSNSDKWALPLTVYNFYGTYQQSWNLIFTDIIITILPLVIIYIFGQKYVVSGMTAGAVKG